MSTMPPSFFIAYAQEDTWTSLAPLQSETYFLGATSIDDKIYAIGGLSFKAGYNTTTEYNPKTDTWTTKSPVPTRISDRHLSIKNLCVVTCQNKIYAIGGMEDVGVVTNTIREYNSTTDTWQTIQSTLIKRTQAVAATLKDKIYIIGGFSGAPVSYYEIYNLTETYDPLTNTSSTKAPIPIPVRGASIAVSNDKIYVFGGLTYDEYACNLTQIYNPETDSWSLGSQIPTGVSFACAGVTSGEFAPRRIILLGGSAKPNISLNLTQIYDPEKDAWSNGTPMSNRRLGLAVVVVDDLFYTLGGYELTPDGGGRVLSNNDIYTPVGYGSPEPTVSPSFSPEPSNVEFPVFIVASIIIIAVCSITILAYRVKTKRRS